VAFAAHVGGFLAGALLVNAFKSRTLLDRREELLASARWDVIPGS
jgi:membrane associated rhomboid family serine protease